MGNSAENYDFATFSSTKTEPIFSCFEDSKDSWKWEHSTNSAKEKVIECSYLVKDTSRCLYSAPFTFNWEKLRSLIICRHKTLNKSKNAFSPIFPSKTPNKHKQTTKNSITRVMKFNAWNKVDSRICEKSKSLDEFSRFAFTDKKILQKMENIEETSNCF